MINNPVMFVGEKILGATVSAPLAADANGQLVSGLSVTEVSATANTTTTSTTDVLMNSMTITPASGTYLVFFSTTVTDPSLATTVTVSIYKGGAQIAHTERHSQIAVTGVLGLGGTSDNVVATQGLTTVNGSQAIEIKWRTSGSTATAFQRTMNILRIS